MLQILIRGSEGKQVIELQNQLATEGYLKDAVDGVFGIKTANALLKKTGYDFCIVDDGTNWSQQGDDTNWYQTLGGKVCYEALKLLVNPLKYEKGNWVDENILGPFKPLLFSNKQILDHTDGRFPWCAAFVHYCTKQVIPDFPMRPKDHWGLFCSVRAWKHAAELTESLKEIHDAVPGDLVIYDWLHDNVDDHIGIFHSHRGNSGMFLSLEGNASNAEGVRIRDQSAVSCTIDSAKLLQNRIKFA